MFLKNVHERNKYRFSCATRIGFRITFPHVQLMKNSTWVGLFISVISIHVSLYFIRTPKSISKEHFFFKDSKNNDLRNEMVFIVICNVCDPRNWNIVLKYVVVFQISLLRLVFELLIRLLYLVAVLIFRNNHQDGTKWYFKNVL